MSVPKGYKWTSQALENRRRGLLRAYRDGKNFGFRHHKSGFTGKDLNAKSRNKTAESVKQAWQDGRLSKAPPKLNEIAPELWRDQLSAGVKRAWAEGRRQSEMTPEVKAQLAEASHQAWIRGELRGFPHKEETKRHLAETTKKAHSEGRLGKPEVEERRLRAARIALHILPNRAEKKLLTLLEKHFPGEWKYTGDGTLTISGYTPDFTNCNGHKAVIECFGRYWHDLRPKLKWHQTELGRIMAYKTLGFPCLIIWEDDLKDECLVVQKVTSFVDSLDKEHKSR